jgi:post-segregation antitoxin (ccd killing protein)
MLPYQAVCPNLPLDLEYINVIAKNILSNTNERNRVDTALDSVKTELTKYDVVKDPTAESLRIVSVATVQQISTEAANGYIEKTLDLLEQARKAEITISVEEKNSINKAIARNALSNSSDPNRIKTAVDIVKTELIKDGIVKDPSAESLKIVSESTVNQILLDAALDTENALGLLKQARQMQIEISINDKNSISASIDSAIFRVSVEDIEKAVAIYNLAEQMQIPVEDPYAIKGLCWFGSLQGHENQTLQYCETAVKLAPQDALIRDSRGLARALTGDFEGAILDFQFFIDEKIKGGNEQNIDVKRRQQWIVDLKVGKNPFTPEVLKTLKSGQLAY